MQIIFQKYMQKIEKITKIEHLDLPLFKLYLKSILLHKNQIQKI